MSPRRAARSTRTADGAPNTRIPGMLMLGVQHRSLSSNQIRQLVSEVDVERLWSSFLRPMLIERTPGSPGSRLVREVSAERTEAGDRASRMKSEPPYWNVYNRTMTRGLLGFVPDGRGRAFVGATDSAVPCAMILELVTGLNGRLQQHKTKGSPLTLQLYFLDGEEAFGEWSETDSLYGARHLAERLGEEPIQGGGGTQLDAIALFVLLDLLGAPDPLILNHFAETGNDVILLPAEKRLHHLTLLRSHPLEVSYFHPDLYYGAVQDDHLPFLRRGVPVLHVISTPFPDVWHTYDDTEENLHRPTVTNLCRILAAFLGETLAL
ncbi:PREDICTED: glutaminyl-peptide cyclotransferase-like protein [Nanorana parkeri]|uniref:glutaminyl-peptide cyclotransferase-like protein n=1 Tax=Nanorana parkeri TaxID=125878 RepID=UPI00085509AB|nr:PREDICTED: glutaminyl-peptide cyclotransferase-like protein [Nanorana parkeri]